MLRTIGSAISAGIALLSLFVVAVLVWAMADPEFGQHLNAWVDDQIAGFIEERPEVQRLHSDLALARAENERLRGSERDRQDELARMSQRLQQLQSRESEANQALEDIKSRHQREFTELQERLQAEAQSKEIAVEQLQNRFTVIRVGDKILFDSGSSGLKPRGKAVLNLIAEALKRYPDRQVRVEGHTDNRPIVTVKKRFPTNWELSSARATAAVRHLQEQGGLDPTRLMAAGMGEYHPVAGNDSSEERARNRRIEIVLMPPIDEFKQRALD